MNKLIPLALAAIIAVAVPLHAFAETPAGPLNCSYYSSKYNGRRTASGQRFNNNRLTAASKTYSMGTRLKLTNVKNGKSAIVTVNDRGPYVSGREISVTRRAAQQMGFLHAGVTQVNT